MHGSAVVENDSPYVPACGRNAILDGLQAQLQDQ